MEARIAELEGRIRGDLRSPVSSTLPKLYGGNYLRRGIAVGFLRVLTLLLQDFSLLLMAWWITQTDRTALSTLWESENSIRGWLPVISICLSMIAARGLYRPGEQRRDYMGIIKAVTFANFLLLLLVTCYQSSSVSTFSSSTFSPSWHFVAYWLTSTLSVVAGRFVMHLGVEYVRSQGAVRYPVFLICDTDSQKRALELLSRENHYNVVGVADARSLDEENREQTFEEVRRLGVAEVFVDWSAIQGRVFLCWRFQTAGTTLHILPTNLDPLFIRPKVWMMSGLPTLKLAPPAIVGVNFWVKRGFDILSSATLLLLFSPVLLAISLLIKLDSQGPIFYKQTRVGLHGHHFQAWKFRTMVVNADKLQKELEKQNETKDGILFKIKDDPRVTRVGKFLRPYSLDELPQLFNVLFGEMSLVGPRPLPLRDVERFSDYHFIRHEVLPGITGLWQVSGRSDITDFDHAVRLDMTYIENWSLWLDLRILLQTVLVVLKKTGAY